ncbi:MAG: hypothetical protein RJA86_292, partial [Pseudomonadota bacterium]
MSEFNAGLVDADNWLHLLLFVKITIQIVQQGLTT